MAGDKRTEGAVYFNLLNAVTYFCCSHLGGSHLTMPFQLTYSIIHIFIIYVTLQTRQVYFLNKNLFLY